MSSRSLNDLHAEFINPVNRWLDRCQDAGLVILITCTLRAGWEQDALYAIGRTVKGDDASLWRPMGRVRTNAQAGQSAHQYGLALDFVPLDCGKPTWSGTGRLWDTAISLAEACGMQSLRPMESAHLQHPTWKQLAGIPTRQATGALR